MKLKNISEVLTLATDFLTERKIDRPRRSAEDLLASALSLKRMDLYMQYDRPLVESELEKMRAILKRRALGEPLEYILGEVEFYGCRIEVSPDVLIPRQETEILVDLVAKKLKERPGSGKVLWDVCTGSGCIGLGLKRAFPELTVVQTDICPKALAMARKNAAKNHLQVDLRLGDLFSPFGAEKADFIVCNPPYISRKEIETLDRSVRDFEPRAALAGGERGTEFYERIASVLPNYLRPGAHVFFEIGYNQGPAVQEIFRNIPWRRFHLLKDWAGQDRFFFLEIE